MVCTIQWDDHHVCTPASRHFVWWTTPRSLSNKSQPMRNIFRYHLNMQWKHAGPHNLVKGIKGSKINFTWSRFILKTSSTQGLSLDGAEPASWYGLLYYTRCSKSVIHSLNISKNFIMLLCFSCCQQVRRSHQELQAILWWPALRGRKAFRHHSGPGGRWSHYLLFGSQSSRLHCRII